MRWCANVGTPLFVEEWSIRVNREIYEGWTVQDFIDELQMQADLIMIGQAIHKPFKTRRDLETWCCEEQPYYKKEAIPEVVEYFAKRYGLT